MKLMPIVSKHMSSTGRNASNHNLGPHHVNWADPVLGHWSWCTL